MTWNEWILNETGYKTISTFWQDFTIADAFGVNAVKDTFKRAFAGWKSDYKMLTELVMVLNHKLGWHYEQGHKELALAYEACWKEADAYACDNLKGEELSYFYEVTD